MKLKNGDLLELVQYLCSIQLRYLNSLLGIPATQKIHSHVGKSSGNQVTACETVLLLIFTLHPYQRTGCTQKAADLFEI